MKVRASNISVRLGSTQALSQVDFDAEPGVVTGLIGANGSGKTTLLRVLAGLQQPDMGVVSYDDVDSRNMGRQRLAQSLSYLAQGSEVHWSLRTDALVALGRLPHRQPFAGLSVRDKEAVEKAMRETDIVRFRDRPVNSLSGGERLRVLLARALAVEAPVFLADEPIAALDPLHQIEVMSMMRRKARDGMTIVIVLHDLSLVTRFCDRLMLMCEGQVVAQGASGDVLTDHHLAAAFGVSVTRGEHNGVPYVLPWEPVAAKPD